MKCIAPSLPRVAADRQDHAASARARLVEALVATGHEDREAFRTVYRLTSAKLFGICLRICGDRQDAEDVLHDVYVIVWRRAGAFEPGRASPITWLATIARNRAIDWQRGRTRHPADPVDDAALALPDPAQAPVDRLVDEETVARLQACLGTLETRQREAIRIAFFDGVRYPEIARRMTLPLGTVKSWVHRGLARLRTCLDGDH